MTGGRPPRRPGLSPEERALWREVTREAVPLDPDRRRAPGPALPPAPAQPAREAPPKASGQPPHDSPDPGDPAEPAPGRSPRTLRPAGPAAPRAPGLDLAGPAVLPVGRPAAGLDRRTAERIRRGTRAPEARIDLHGMTAERAHRALERRIAESLALGHRLVLVITGKGGRRGDPDNPFARPGEGRLRREAPRWLRSGPHARDIVGIFEAHARHGGAGAFYVYLKRRR